MKGRYLQRVVPRETPSETEYYAVMGGDFQWCRVTPRGTWVHHLMMESGTQWCRVVSSQRCVLQWCTVVPSERWVLPIVQSGVQSKVCTTMVHSGTQ